MVTIKIGKKMYDITEGCPKCGKEEVFLSRYGHRIICGFCRNWVFTDEAVDTPWVKESEKYK